jgi:hypothetical protein
MFPIRYELTLYVIFRRNSVFKVLIIYSIGHKTLSENHFSRKAYNREHPL